MLTVLTPTILERRYACVEAEESVLRQTVETAHLIRTDLHREGPAVIRNELAGKATTEWIGFLDDDDLLHPDYTETVSPYFADYDVVYTWGDGLAEWFQHPFDAERLKRGNYIPVTACVRKSLFDQVGGFPTDVAYEDWGLWLRLLAVDARFKCVESVHWTYRDHLSDRRTHSNNRGVAEGRLKRV